jgi:hypothetical protein
MPTSSPAPLNEKQPVRKPAVSPKNIKRIKNLIFPSLLLIFFESLSMHAITISIKKSQNILGSTHFFYSHEGTTRAKMKSIERQESASLLIITQQFQKEFYCLSY